MLVCPTDLISAFGENPINTVARRSIRTVLAATACSAVVATGLTACSAVQQLSAADKVAKAFDRIDEGRTFRAQFSVEATPDQLIAFGKAVHDPIEPKAAEALSGLSLEMAVSADKPLKELDSFKKAQESGDFNTVSEDAALDFSYVLSGRGGKVYVDLRHVDAKTYLKLDLAALAELGGEDPAKVRGFADEFPSDLKALKDAMAGQWISLDPKVLEKFGEEAAAGAPGRAKGGATPSAKPSLDPKTAKDLNKTIGDVLSHNLSFEDKGKKDGTEHLVVSAPARRLADELLKAVKPAAKDLPQLKTLPSAAPTSVPDRTVGVDLYLKDGSLSALTFDVAQLAKDVGPDVHLPVKLAFSKDAPAPQAPGAATPLTSDDLEGIMGAVVGAALGEGGPGRPGGPAGRTGGTGGTGADDASLDDLPPGEPLTDAQVKELVAGGLTEAQISTYSKLGLGFQDMKDLLDMKS
ncbi:hypothetical protein [Kitasatospora sp. NPDC050543]|uniref:hypothetical protein n=1 Tax=Kitasatospora sp. NPDC050543 TaxID=3364054 RepID=UPI003796574A